MFDFKNKKIIITGSEGLLGSALCNQIVFLGGEVIPIDISTCDLRDKTQVDKAYAEAFNNHSHIHGLVNNAAVSYFTDSSERTDFEFSNTCETNLKGTFNCISSFSKYCLEFHQTRASIVNIGSIYGLISPDFRLYKDKDRKNSEIYGATKAGVIQMTKYFSVYLAPQKIRVNSVSPGGIYNAASPPSRDFLKAYSDRCPMGRMAKVEEITGGVLYLLDDCSSYTNGHNLIIDGGYSCW